MSIRFTLPIYDSYGRFSISQYLYRKWGVVISDLNLGVVDGQKATDFLENAGYTILKKNEYYKGENLIADKTYIKGKLVIHLEYNFGVCSCTIYYNKKENPYELALKLIDFKIKKENGNQISIVTMSENTLRTREFDIKIGDVNVGVNYGEKFIPVYNRIITALTKNTEKGLILLHGVPGTGKTSLIKYLVKQLDRKVLFIPSSLGESLSSPNFLHFLLDNKDSVLIIEDAEKIIADRESEFNSFGVANILNISDGLLGDCLNVQIIATFNTKRERIDSALLRKGRLIAEHEFEALTVEDSNKLFSHLGRSCITNKELTLAEIYNFDEIEYKQQTNKNKIGFLQH